MTMIFTGVSAVFATPQALMNIFQSLNGEIGDGGENNNQFFSFLTLFRQNKKEKMRRKQNQQCKWNYEEKKTLKQQQEAIDDSCFSIYFLTL